MMRMRRTAIGGVLALGLIVAAIAPAAAQAGLGALNPGQNGFQPMVMPNQTGGKAEGPASALPGATPGRGVTPADKSVADLAPNDALFDAINRGDIGEARDAVNRGADINAENVLGMRPLELSVDLSRNDITFYLLSLRGATAGALSAKAAAAAAKQAPAAATPLKVTRVADRSATPKSGSANAVPRPYAISSADPGRPDPEAGFLGFGHGGP